MKKNDRMFVTRLVLFVLGLLAIGFGSDWLAARIMALPKEVLSVALYAVLVLAGLVWVVSPLLRRVPCVIITAGMIGALLALPMQGSAQSVSPAQQQEQADLAVAELMSTVPPVEGEPTQVCLVCALQIMLVTVVIGGVVYVGYRLFRACEKISERRLPLDEDDARATNTTRRASSIVGGESPFLMTPDPVPRSFTMDVPAQGDILLSPYRAAETESVAQCLARHGLGLPGTNSYSIQDLPSLEWSLTGERQLVIERSADLRTWHPLPPLPVPDGAKVLFTDATGDACYFYRARVAP